jgi:hypothetical protein
VAEVVDSNSSMNGEVVAAAVEVVALSSMNISVRTSAASLVEIVVASVWLLVEGCVVVAGSVEVTGLVAGKSSAQHTPREPLTNENGHVIEVQVDGTLLPSRTGIVEENLTRLVQFRSEAAPQERAHSALVR